MTPHNPKQTSPALALPPARPAEPPLPFAPALYGGLAFAGGDSYGPPALSAPPTLSGLLQALRRRWLVAVTLGAAAAALAVAAVFSYLPPRYVVEARFNVTAAAETGAVAPGQDPHAEFAVFKEYEKALIRSPMVLAAALNEKVSAGREARDLPLVRAQGNGVIDWLDRALKADFKVAPEIMSAFLSGDDPEGLADLLNAVGTAFVKENIEKEKARRKERVESYRENLKLKQADLSGLRARYIGRNQPEEARERRGKEDQLQQAKEDLRVTKGVLQTLELRRDENEMDLTDWQAKLKGIDTHPVPIDQVDEFLRGDGQALVLKQRIAEIESKIIEIREKSATPEIAAPQVRVEQSKRNELLRDLERRRKTSIPEVAERYRTKTKADLTEKIETAQRKRGSLATSIKGKREEVDRLSKLIATLDQAVGSDPPDLAHLKDEIKSTETAVDRIQQAIIMLEVEPANSRVSFLVRANPPTDKDYSRQLKLGGAGGVSAFAFVLFAIALWEFRTRRISQASEVSQGLGLNVVGSLPTVRAPTKREAANGTLVAQTQLQEAIDGARTMLLHAARTEPLRIIMVTSACSGEGKTSVATQLAASLARAWRKTLLIDGDLRSPAAHRVFELPRDPGLCEVLRGEVAIEDAVRPAPISRLWVLPAGQWDAGALQALAQDEVRTLFEKLKGEYDFIIVDSSPVLPVADALLLAQQADGVLFSILRDVSRVPEVFAAQQRLAPLGVRTLGAVVIGMASELSKRAYEYAAS